MADDLPINLHLKKGSEEKYQTLVRAANSTTVPVPCHSDPDKWTSYDQDGVAIPTSEEAQAMCAGCPVWNLCQDFARAENPAIGIYAGEVFGVGMIIAERKGLL